jgi:hypothetical protein
MSFDQKEGTEKTATDLANKWNIFDSEIRKKNS